MIPILRSNDYFGQYGKISKILLHKRTPPGSSDPIVGIYIAYQRREDAARAIEKIDGSASPSGDGEVMHTSFGTAKYCISFLRSVSCMNTGCLDVHEWGDDRDCFTRQDLISMYVWISPFTPPLISLMQKASQQGDGETHHNKCYHRSQIRRR